MLRNVNKAKSLFFLATLATVGYLVYRVGSGNDKSVLFMLFPVCGLMGYKMRGIHPKVASYLYWAALYLIILFLPLLLITLWLTF
jgi:hypothetical protein